MEDRDGARGETRVAVALIEVDAPAARVFELLADPSAHARLDGNDNVASAAQGQRVRAVGEVFVTRLTGGEVRENHVVDFAEGRRIAWRPAEPGREPPGHEWAYALEPLAPARTRVTHTYDWTALTDEGRIPRARRTTPDRLAASLARLKALAEDGG